MQQKFLLAGAVLVGLAAVIAWFFMDNKPSAAGYVKTFCACAEPYVQALDAKEAQKLSDAEYQAAMDAHRTCLGTYNPFQGLSPKDSMAQLHKLLIEMRNQCPKTAIRLGFNL